MYKVRVNGQTITITGGPEIAVAETLNVQECKFIFDNSWSGLTCYACFKNTNIIEESQILLDNTYICMIPQAVVAEPGDLYVGVLGVNASNGNIVKPTVWQRLALVLQGISPTGQIIDDSPSAIAQLTNIAETALDTANEAKDEVNTLSLEINNKVDKVEGKGLSTNDFTDSDKSRLNNTVIQYTSLPTSIADHLGEVVQYIGPTLYSLTQGYHYVAVYVNDSYSGESGYFWRQIEKDFKEFPDILPYVADYNNLEIIHYIGPNGEFEQFDRWYIPNFNGSSWYWEDYTGN